MESADLILGLFFSNEDNLIFEKLKFSEDLSQDKKDQLRMLSFQFLGAVFLTAACVDGSTWRIELIESSLSLRRGITVNGGVIQSFFNLNSSIESKDGITNLFAIIGSPFTEDIKISYQKMVDYIHPSIFQGREVNKHTLGQDFKLSRFINEELSRGLDLIEYNLGTSRKMHWEEQQKYYCVGLIEREISSKSKTSYLYTFDKDISLRKQFLNYIPSYYVMAILPDYYENLVDQTLKLFGKTNVQSNIRKIILTHQNKKVLYFEEYTIQNEIKKSYGVILIPDDNKIKDAKNISFYHKNVRLILDVHKDLKDIMFKINPDLKYEKWGTVSEEDLNKIRMCLDNLN